MKLTILVDNNTFIGRYFQAEPALSMYIEDQGKKILFDAGYSDVVINNARKMNINLLDLDYIVLSHGHLDHTWGLTSLIKLYTEATYEKYEFKKPKIVAHPDTFYTKSKNSFTEVGSILSKEKLENSFELILTREPFYLTDKLLFLGEIKRDNDFEGRNIVGKIIKDNEEHDDYMIEDSALAYKTSKGLVVITGCSHSGICNIIEYARKTCNEKKVFDVIGGFHLLNPSEDQLKKTLEYIRSIDSHSIYACHCTTLYSKIELAKVAKIKETGVGLNLKYE